VLHPSDTEECEKSGCVMRDESEIGVPHAKDAERAKVRRRKRACARRCRGVPCGRLFECGLDGSPRGSAPTRAQLSDGDWLCGLCTSSVISVSRFGSVSSVPLWFKFSFLNTTDRERARFLRFGAPTGRGCPQFGAGVREGAPLHKADDTLMNLSADHLYPRDGKQAELIPGRAMQDPIAISGDWRYRSWRNETCLSRD
jgi:hypothetical protein